MTAMRYFDHHIATPLLALTLLLASGCRSNVSTSEPATESTSSTMVTLRTSVIGTMSPRALSESNADPLDGSGEGEVHKLNLWLAKEGWMQATPDTRNAPIYQATFKVNGVQNPSERRDYTILLNGHTLPLNTLSRSEQTTIGIDQISLLMDEKGFTMTGAVNLSAVIKPDVVTPARPGDNVFPKDEDLPVERVVSKAQLYKKSGFAVTGVPGTIANLHWAVAGSGKQVYLYRNQAGDRTMGIDGLYDGLTTASTESGLMKLSDVIKNTTEEGNFAWKELSGSASEKKSVAGGIYFYEHALPETSGKDTPYPRTIGYDKVTYAKVYGDLGKISKGKRGEFNEKAFPYFSAMSRVVYTEKEARKLTTSELPNATGTFKRSLETWEKMRKYVKDASSEDFMKDRWYWICVTEIPSWDMAKKKELFDSSRFSIPDLMDSHEGHTFFLMHDTPGTFYVGANGIIYDTLLAARADGNKSARKYAGGRMVYLTPLNAQGEPNKIYNCDTRRNNIYDLEIQGVNGLGYNYDPVDPKDPYIPKPDDNPLEPDPDPEIPPINNPEITIKVKATVLKWNYIHQSYDLLGKTK